MKRNRYDKCVLGCLVLAAAGGMVLAQTEMNPTNQPQRLVDYVPPVSSTTNAAPAGSSQPNLFPTTPTNVAIVTTTSSVTSTERWERFEADFGIKLKDPSFVKSSIESAKYKVDETLFAAKEFADTLHYDAYLTDLLTGSHSAGAPRRYYTDPILDSLENARIRTGVDWDAQSGRAFIGLRLMVPFGD